MELFGLGMKLRHLSLVVSSSDSGEEWRAMIKRWADRGVAGLEKPSYYKNLPFPLRIKARAGTAQEWADQDPCLEDEEIGWEDGTDKYKLGTGAAKWSELPYE